MGRAPQTSFEHTGAGAVLVALVCSACTPVFTTIGHGHGPRGDFELDRGSDGRWLGMMTGAFGADVAELPGGDVLLSGQGRSTFVSRIASDGDEVWSLSLASCSSPRVAAGSDDELYVTVEGLRTLAPGATESPSERKARCDRTLGSRTTDILRLNGHGSVLWQAQAFMGPQPARLLATKGRLLAMGYANPALSSTPTSVIHSYTADGRREWTREYPGSLTVEAWANGGRTILGAFSGQGEWCSLRALDATTGDVAWSRPLDLEVVDSSWCSPRELDVTRRGALLWTSGPSDTVAGLDLTTGKPFWTKEPENFDGPMPSTFAGLAPRDLGLFVRYGVSQRHGSLTDPVLVGVDPKSGNAARLATFEENIPDVMSDGAYMASHVWGRTALLVTGSFYGGLHVFDMDVSTGPRYDTSCASIDPGFCIGGCGPPPQKRVVMGSRGHRDVICPSLTYERRLRTYESTLFLARFPVSSFARAR